MLNLSFLCNCNLRYYNIYLFILLFFKTHRITKLGNEAFNGFTLRCNIFDQIGLSIPLNCLVSTIFFLNTKHLLSCAYVYWLSCDCWNLKMEMRYGSCPNRCTKQYEILNNKYCWMVDHGFSKDHWQTNFCPSFILSWICRSMSDNWTKPQSNIMSYY